MARQRSTRGVSEGSLPLELRPVAEAALGEAVANLAMLNLAGLRLQWRNVFGGSAPVHLPKPLLARILAYRLQADAFGDLPDAVRRTLEGFGARGSAPRRTSGWAGLATVDFATDQTRLHPGSRMGWPSPPRHGAGGRLRLGRQDLPQPLQGRAGALSRWRLLLVNRAKRSSAADRKINGLESSSVVLDPSKIRYSWPT